MTYCLGIKVADGLVALADTQVVRGSERLNKAKLATLDILGPQVFLMTSGLRSVRDKAVIYLEEEIAASASKLDRLYKVANAFGTQLRRVRAEDAASLSEAGLHFNLHAILGGRLRGDSEPALFYIFPEGNWVEAASDSPYFALGRTPYGKPILDRLLRAETSLPAALALSYLAFDATRASVTDVDFPIDVLVHDTQTDTLRRSRLEAHDLLAVRQWWRGRLDAALHEMPLGWAAPLLGEQLGDRNAG